MFESCVVAITLFRSFFVPVRNETKRTSPTNFKCQSYVPSWSSRKAFDVFTKTLSRKKITHAMIIERLLVLRLTVDAAPPSPRCLIVLFFKGKSRKKVASCLRKRNKQTTLLSWVLGRPHTRVFLFSLFETSIRGFLNDTFKSAYLFGHLNTRDNFISSSSVQSHPSEKSRDGVTSSLRLSLYPVSRKKDT